MIPTPARQDGEGDRVTTLDEGLTVARDVLSEVLESIIVQWDSGRIDNVGATDLILGVIRKANEARPDHQHRWVDMTNEIVSGGELCLICRAIRPTE